MSIIFDPLTGEPIETNDLAGDAIDKVEDVVQESAVTENMQEPVISITTDNTKEQNELANVENTEELSESISSEYAKEQSESITTEKTEEPNDSLTIEEDESITKEEINFDPLTGEPIKRNEFSSKQENIEQNNQFSPIPSDVNPPQNNKFFLIAALAVVAVLVLCLLFLSGLFMSDKQKVARAIRETFDYETEIGKIGKNILNILETENYTSNVGLTGNEFGFISMQSIVEGKDKQIVLNLDIDQIPKISAKIGIDNKNLKLEIPELSDKLLVYSYKEDKRGAITQYLDDETLESLDKRLEELYNGDSKTVSDEFNIELNKELNECIKEHSEELEFEKVDASVFEVDGKEVKCKGYRVDVDNEFILDFYDDITDIYIGKMEDELSEIDDVTGRDLEDSFEELRDVIKEIPDMNITFYIYKNQLAAVLSDIDDSEYNDIDIFFEGGDYRAQNIVIKSDDEEVFALKGSNKADKEIYIIDICEEEIFRLDYNIENNTIKLEGNFDEDKFVADINVDSSSKYVEFKINNLEISDESIGMVTFRIEKGGNIQEYVNTQEFDIGSATEADFNNFLYTINLDYLRSFERTIY